MKEIIYNYDNLINDDITETVIRTKALIINGKNIYIGNANDVFQFPGGHLEDNESFSDCLKREIMEETGIEIEDNDIDKAFMKVTYMNKDWPEKGKNRKAEIYYYVVKTNKYPDLTKTNYTENEKKHNFKVDIILLKDAIKIIENNINKNEMNKVISPDMIEAIKEYLKQEGIND